MKTKAEQNLETAIIVALALAASYWGYNYINNRRNDSSLNVNTPPNNNIPTNLPPSDNISNILPPSNNSDIDVG